MIFKDCIGKHYFIMLLKDCAILLYSRSLFFIG